LKSGTLDKLSSLNDKAGVFARFGHVLLIIALLGATGAHWAVMQSVAWATMLADNSHTASLSQALEKTFDGKHPCALCKQISRAKQSERKSDFQSDLKKLEFLNDRPAFWLRPPGHFDLLPESNILVAGLVQQPPVPPPRSLPG
jgi:hypothetical protein